MYKLPSDVYSPRCSPSGSENRIRVGASQRTRQLWGLDFAGGSTLSPDYLTHKSLRFAEILSAKFLLVSVKFGVRFPVPVKT